jgi:carbamoyl-phosphate synthase large subunit
VFISVSDRDKEELVSVARTLQGLGFELLATRGTHAFLEGQGIHSQMVLKVWEGRPNVEDMIKNGEIAMVMNTASGRKPRHDSALLRQATLLYNIPYSTTVAGARAMALAVRERVGKKLTVTSLQEYYGKA